MSEVKLNLVDANHILVGTIHGSVVDACVAALSAEPETIVELEAALARYIKPVGCGPFTSFRVRSEIDPTAWDAGLVVIDLSLRIVAAESSYSQPHAEGQVTYHDGTAATELSVLYQVSSEWRFFNSLIEYEASVRRGQVPVAPLDARSVLYGRPLLEFVATTIRQLSAFCTDALDSALKVIGCLEESIGEPDMTVPAVMSEDLVTSDDEAFRELVANEISAIHARWLMSKRDELRGQSPRDVLLAKRKFIDFDLHSRELQWSMQGEGPPCLARESAAYRFAGFGTHEGVLYYELVRHLLWNALKNLVRTSTGENPQAGETLDVEEEIARLEEIKTVWLESPNSEFGLTPANTIENERRRLPLTLTRDEMIIDDDCDICVMMANDPTMGPAFWHLDGCNMDDDFVFSDFLTREEWEAENRRRQEFHREFNRDWEERQQRIARGEPVDDAFDLDWIDSLNASSRPGASDDDDESHGVIQ